jgi:3-phenylpropionate/trans-cinnamate dioxygenase ferredoxin subunit
VAELVSVNAEVSEGQLAAFEVGGERIAIANVDGTLYAFDDSCPHRQCSLADGALQGTVVTCPCHGSRFDVTSGERLQGPAARPVRTYAVQVEKGTLKIEL